MRAIKRNAIVVLDYCRVGHDFSMFLHDFAVGGAAEAALLHFIIFRLTGVPYADSN